MVCLVWDINTCALLLCLHLTTDTSLHWLMKRTMASDCNGTEDCNVSLLTVLSGCLTISLHDMGYALVGPVILLMPFLVLKGGLDSSHNQHKCQRCCGPKP